MRLEDLLKEKKSAIVKKWFDAVMRTYPNDSQGFLRKEKDRFSNPVGHTVSTQIEALYDLLIEGEDARQVSACLDSIIRIRAIQELKPSKAIGFVVDLKRLVREELGGRPGSEDFAKQLGAMEDRIDRTALMAFDIYSKCRQKIYDIRVNEIKNQVDKLLKRANLVYEIPELEPGLGDDKTDGVT